MDTLETFRDEIELKLGKSITGAQDARVYMMFMRRYTVEEVVAALNPPLIPRREPLSGNGVDYI